MARKSAAVAEPEEVVETDDTETLETQAVEATPAGEAADVQPGGDVGTGAEPAFSAEALELSQRTGLDVADYKDEPAFYRAVARYDRQASDLMRQLEGRRMQETRNPPAGQAQGQPTPAATLQALKRLELEKFFPKDPDGEINPQIVNAIKAIDEHYHGHLDSAHQKLSQFEELSKKVQAFEEFIQYQQQQQFEQEWDDFFASVGDDYKKHVGSGSGRELMGTPSALVRNDIVGLALSLRQMDENRGLRPLPNKLYGQRALQSVLATETNAIARKQILAKAQQRNGAALAGTNGKQPRKRSPEDRAYQVYKEKMAAMGMTVPDE